MKALVLHAYSSNLYKSTVYSIFLNNKNIELLISTINNLIDLFSNNESINVIDASIDIGKWIDFDLDGKFEKREMECALLEKIISSCDSFISKTNNEIEEFYTHVKRHKKEFFCLPIMKSVSEMLKSPIINSDKYQIKANKHGFTFYCGDFKTKSFGYREFIKLLTK